MRAILCNWSLWSHFCSSKIYMRPPWTLSNCIWRFSTLQRRYLTFGDISVRWRWVKWFSKNSFCSGKTSRFLKICFYKLQKDCPPGGQSFDTGMRMFGNYLEVLRTQKLFWENHMFQRQRKENVCKVKYRRWSVLKRQIQLNKVHYGRIYIVLLQQCHHNDRLRRIARVPLCPLTAVWWM